MLRRLRRAAKVELASPPGYLEGELLKVAYPPEDMPIGRGGASCVRRQYAYATSGIT